MHQGEPFCPMAHRTPTDMRQAAPMGKRRKKVKTAWK